MSDVTMMDCPLRSSWAYKSPLFLNVKPWEDREIVGGEGGDSLGGRWSWSCDDVEPVRRVGGMLSLGVVDYCGSGWKAWEEPGVGEGGGGLWKTS